MHFLTVILCKKVQDFEEGGVKKSCIKSLKYLGTFHFMPYLETFIDTTIKGIWDWRYPTTTLWLEARTNELEDCYLAGMPVVAKVADQAGLA